LTWLRTGRREEERQVIKTAVITDTNSGISVREGEEMGIYVLPMPVIVDGKEYTEGVDITHEALFEALESGKPAMTSQPSPADLKALWERHLQMGRKKLYTFPCHPSSADPATPQPHWRRNTAERFRWLTITGFP